MGDAGRAIVEVEAVMRFAVVLVLLVACDGATVDAGPGDVSEAACAGAVASADVPYDAPRYGDDGKQRHATWRQDTGPTVTCEDVLTSGDDGTLDLVVTWTGEVYDDPDPTDAQDGAFWYEDTMRQTWRDVEIHRYDQGWAVVP